MVKKLLAIFAVLFSLILLTRISYAQTRDSFVEIVMPVRGSEFWDKGGITPAQSFRSYLGAIDQRKLKSTFLLRFDALSDPNITDVLKSDQNRPEVGIFLEITPKASQAAGVNYHTSSNWHQAYSVLVTGYEPSERRKLIDAYFAKYKSVFGDYPKSVGAWWIDGDSLAYMHDKYGVIANLSVADQFSTDSYQVWGQFWSSPFYPSKFNASQPAQREENKTGTVAIQWALRDPYNGYGERVEDSTYSVQANDYLTHPNLSTNYFSKLLDIYLNQDAVGQVTVGIENDFIQSNFKEEFNRQLDEISKRKNRGQVLTTTMWEFATWYRESYPKLSPPQILFSQNPLNANEHVLWYSNNGYRLGLFQSSQNMILRDLRSYSDTMAEPCLKASCRDLDLARTVAKPIDDVTYRQHLLIQEGLVTNMAVAKEGNNLRVRFTDSLGENKDLLLAPNDIYINGKPSTVNGLIIETTKSQTREKIPLTNSGASIQMDLPYSLKSLAVFLLSIIFLFYLPGRLISKKIYQLSSYEEIVLSITFGISYFILISLLSLLIRNNWIIWVATLVPALISLKSFRPQPIKKIQVFPLAALLVGVIISVLPVFKSGLLYPFGMGFWGPNGHDAIWHLSLIESLKYSGFPPENFVLAATSLQNYHYFFDLIIAKLSLVPYLDSLGLYFRLWPLLVSLSLGGSLWVLAKKLKLNSFSTGTLILLTFLGGSWGGLVSFIRNRDFGGESMFWANQSVSLHLNPPFVLSLLFITATSILMFTPLNGWKKRIILAVLISLLWGIKAYSGVLVLGAVLLISIVQFFKSKDSELLKTSFLAALFSLIIFLPLNRGATSLFEFSPFWLVNSMIDSTDRLSWERLANAKLVYSQTGNLKLIVVEVLGLLIFLLGNFGCRLIGFGSWIRSFKNTNVVLKILGLIALLGVIPPVLFIQRGNSWNVIQFLYYSMFVLTIFSAIYLNSLKNKTIITVAIVVLILSSLTTFGTLKQYFPGTAASYLSTDELAALSFLKSQPAGNVLSEAFDKTASSNFDSPIPQYAYAPSAYISAFSSKPNYLEDEINLDILGVDYNSRLIAVDEFLKSPQSDWTSTFLKNTNIKYIYVHKQKNYSLNNLNKIFENGQIEIYRID